MVPVFWLGLLRLSGVSLFTISIPGILFASVLIWQYIGFPTLFFYLDDYRVNFIQDRSIIWMMFFGSVYSITMILIGFIAASRKLGPLHLKNQYNSFHDLFFQAGFTERWIIYSIFGVSTVVLSIYISKVGLGNLALLAALGMFDTDASSKVLRSAMGNAFEGRYHWYKLFIRDFLSIATVALFAHWLMSRKLKALLLFLATFMFAAFSTLMATEKGPFLWYLISLLMIYIIIRKSGRLSPGLVTILSPFALLVIGLIYVYFMGSQSILAGIQSGYSRITSGQMAGLYHYLIIFPDQVDYLLGKSFPNPRGIFPWEPYRLTVEVMNMVNPSLESMGIVGSMPTFFWGEMYANFGYLGILIPPFFVGYVVYAINILIFRLPMSPLVLSIFVYVILYIENISGTGLSGYIINIHGAIMAVFTIVALGIIGGGIIKFRKRRTIKFVNTALANRQNFPMDRA
jgi:oligosaccharide repeat unit polymerase